MCVFPIVIHTLGNLLVNILCEKMTHNELEEWQQNVDAAYRFYSEMFSLGSHTAPHCELASFRINSCTRKTNRCQRS